MLQFVKLHWGCQFCLGRDFRWFVALKSNGPLNLSPVTDRQFFSLRPDASANRPGDVRVLRHHQEIAAQPPVQTQTLRKRCEASPDFAPRIQCYRFVESRNVLRDRSADGNVVRKRSDIAIHLTVDSQRLREGNDVAGHMAIHVYVRRKHKQISFDGAFDARPMCKHVNIALYCFPRRHLNRIALARFCRRSRGWQRQHCAESREDQRQRGTPPDFPPEEQRDQSRQGQHRQHFEECDHGLPPFPHCPLKNQQPEQV